MHSLEVLQSPIESRLARSRLQHCGNAGTSTGSSPTRDPGDAHMETPIHQTAHPGNEPKRPSDLRI
jgi:hypothetical protein